MNSIVKNNQSLFDIALQSGSIENVFAIAENNDLSITDDLLPGTNLDVGQYKNTFNSISEISQDVAIKKQTTFVRNGQSILDIAIQESGDVEEYFSIASANNIESFDDDIIGLKIINANKKNARIVEEMSKRNKPATAGNYEGNTYGEYEQTEYTNQEYNV